MFQERNLSTLDLIKINLIGGKDEILKEDKLSSSARRRALLGTFLKPLKLEKFPRPFVIGLTGGTASGKTNAANFLARNNCKVSEVVFHCWLIILLSILNSVLESHCSF